MVTMENWKLLAPQLWCNGSRKIILMQYSRCTNSPTIIKTSRVSNGCF